MRVRIQVIALAFDVDELGRSSITSIFSTFRMTNPPEQMPEPFMLIFGLEIEADDVGRDVDFYLRVIDPNGFSVEKGMGLERLDKQDVAEPFTLYMNSTIKGLAFGEYGPHEFQLRIRGQDEPVATAVLEVLRPEPQLMSAAKGVL